MASPDETRVDQPVRLRPVWSLYGAWQAVDDGKPIDEYLLYRFRIYESQGRKSSHPLRYDIAITPSGRIVLTGNPQYEQYWADRFDDSAEDRDLEFMSRIEREALLAESERIQAEQDRVTADLRDLEEALEKLVMDEIAAIREGEPGKTTLARQDEKRSRQQLPFPWFPVLGYLAIAFLLLDETFQIVWPYLDYFGFDPGNIAFEFARAPLFVAGVVALAISTTVGLMFVWNSLLSNALKIATGWETAGPLPSALRLVRLLFLCVFLFIFTLAIAFLRHSTTSDATSGQTGGFNTASIVLVCLTVLMPAASACLHQKIAESSYWQRRSDLQAEHARQSQANDQLHLPRNQRHDLVEILESKRAPLEEQRASLDARRRAIAEHVVSTQEKRRARLTYEQEAAAIYLTSLVAALESDRNFYLHFARRYKKHLVPTEPVCLSPQSSGETFTEAKAAPSQAEPPPRYRVTRPLLTEGQWHEI